MAIERQADSAIKLYQTRSSEYDATWHADFTKRFITYLDIQRGQHVLDLACGTGLLTFLEADAVGSEGQVVGIDVTPGMLAIATRKKEHLGDKCANTHFIRGDILHLDEVDELENRLFDVITVASALVLLPDPIAALEHWWKYLKPGGVIAADAAHPRNLVSGMVLERTAWRLGLSVPYNRSWSRTESTLKQKFEDAGFEVEKVVTVEDQAGYGRRLHDLDRWDDFFVENVILKDVTRTFANNNIRRKAQGIYKEEWEKLAVDGKVEEVDAVFLGVARKPHDGSRYTPATSSSGTVFEGGCRCGAVRYTSSTAPSDITLCYCRACQQLSGSNYLAFVDVPCNALNFTSESTRKMIKLSESAERTFCSGCGAPLSMIYLSSPDRLHLIVATIDPQSLRLESPLVVAQHIYLCEKAPWTVLPNDGAERWATSR
ncbi:S-adenosyl-L-methionine-dependent methyltransferase [Plenodomus tracheiphilus IPT5]|uniref:S-adenosyl-L-methionine-dependent methyltransferase n=1 Tax=Plenodomus tracheiphilus IPT5 TaxID=1408161 RepID=A0A6A7BI54_9PLEO|nr:S-adenosyl-L-methionine-dependent methyltransferase [Plenodomus tracheiphilus IPT5]